MKEKPTEYPWMPLVRAEAGQKEIPGPKANPFIVECLESTHLDHADAISDETAWCAAFANRMIEKAGFKGTDSAAALDFLKWGVKAKKPYRKGAVLVFSRGPGHGHAAFYEDENETQFLIWGGNQHDMVCKEWKDKGTLLGAREPAQIS